VNVYLGIDGGGTRTRAVEPERQRLPVLTDAQVVRLVRLGRRIEAHFGRPQDIEWCLVGEEFEIVQSRPITTLFPVPVTDDGENHLYVSVGHQQMMTDAMKPLGLAFWQLTTPRPMAEAGGRLFVDVAPILATPAGRARMLDLARSDPLIGDALQTVIDRGDFLPSRPDEEAVVPPAGSGQAPVEADPALVAAFVERSRASLAALERDIRTRSGPELFDFILADIGELRRVLFDAESLKVIMAGMEASRFFRRSTFIAPCFRIVLFPLRVPSRKYAAQIFRVAEVLAKNGWRVGVMDQVFAELFTMGERVIDHPT